MNINQLTSDDAILTELGHRLARHRLDLSMTQAQLAEQAGVSKRTVERIEAGKSAQLLTIIRILRVLTLLEGFEQLIPEPLPRPIELLQTKGKTRQRAPSGTGKHDVTEVPWTWDDDA